MFNEHFNCFRPYQRLSPTPQTWTQFLSLKVTHRESKHPVQMCAASLLSWNLIVLSSLEGQMDQKLWCSMNHTGCIVSQACSDAGQTLNGQGHGYINPQQKADGLCWAIPWFRKIDQIIQGISPAKRVLTQVRHWMVKAMITSILSKKADGYCWVIP